VFSFNAQSKYNSDTKLKLKLPHQHHIHHHSSLLSTLHPPIANQMGAGGSVNATASSSSNPSTTQPSNAIPEYKVQSSTVSELRCPEKFILRLEPEAVVFMQEDSTGQREAFQHFPYYVIMCWGHSLTSFQFRLFRQGSQVKTIVVRTRQGVAIEKQIMIVVRGLMAKMEKHGTSKEEFAEFIKILATLSEQEESQDTVQKVSQFCQVHSLTINQAKSIMKRAYVPDPFDRIELASAIKPALINQDSFQMVLHTFENYNDRLNLCHRLKLSPEMASSETVALREVVPKPVKQKEQPDEEEEDRDHESEADVSL